MRLYPAGPSLALGLFLVTGLTGFAADPLRLTHDVVPTAQSVELKLDPSREDFTGRTTISLHANRAFTSFRLHANGPAFTTAELVAADDTRTTLTAAITHADMGLVTLTAPQKLPAGDYELTIDFTAPYRHDGVGLYKTTSRGDPYLFTQFEEVEARKAIPCWDEPEFKIAWQLTLTVPAKLEAVANTPATSTTRDGNWQTITYERTPPMPAYLVALAVGPLEFVPVPGLRVPGRIVTARGQSALTGEAVRLSPPLLQRLEDYFGIPYPYAKLDQIAVPEYVWGAMENVGLITYTDRTLLQDPAKSSFNARRSLADTMAHEMAHMWFGNLVTMKWWDDIWLNESFADWICAKVVDEEYPEFRIKIQQSEAIHGAMRSDALPSITAVRRNLPADADFDQLFDELSYSKGKGILNMVENWIGPEKFRTAMQVYFKKYAWGSTTSDDLWATMNPIASENIVKLMSGYVNQPGMPLVSLSLEPDGRLQINQSRLRNLGDPALPGLWQVPLVLKWSKAGQVHELRLLLRDASTTLTVPELTTADWIYPNAGEAGYYRWQLAPTLNHRLAHHATELAPIERIGLLDNNTALFNAGLIDGTAHLTYLSAFSQDLDPDVCSNVIGGINGLRDGFITPATQPAYHAFKRAILRPMLTRIGLQPTTGEPAFIGPLRSELFAALGYEVADPEVVAECRRLTALFLQDAKSVDATLRSTILAVSAYHGDAALLTTLQGTITSAPNPLVRSAAIRALGRFHDPVLAAQALAWSLTPALNSTEFLNVATGLSGDPAMRAQVVAWLMANYDAVAAKAPSEYTAGLIRYAGTTDRDLFNQLREFLQTPARRSDYGDINIAKASDRLKVQLRLRAQEQANILKYLETYSGTTPKD